jgi:hypothetical protein
VRDLRVRTISDEKREREREEWWAFPHTDDVDDHTGVRYGFFFDIQKSVARAQDTERGGGGRERERGRDG